MYMRNKVKKIILFSYMPKTDTDYSNTIFYKIQCKNPDVKDMYIGHTTNFVQRKLAHKYSCIYDKCANYHCKVYNVIRENGGWDNWNMEIIAFHNCEDLYAARKLEQQYFEQYNATLNSVEPLPKPKTILSKNIPVKIENKQMQTSVEVENKKTPLYECVSCRYRCSKLSEWNRHEMTRKHRLTTNNGIRKSITHHVCACGNTYKHRQGLSFHRKTCTIRIESQPVLTDIALTIPNPDTSIIHNLLEQNNELKTLMVRQCTQIQELNKHNIEIQCQLVNAVNKLEIMATQPHVL